MMAVGDSYSYPEKGWVRKDDSEPDISYIGNWSTVTYQEAYKGSYKFSNTMGSEVKFNFTGSKFRLLTRTYNDRSKDIKVILNNEEHAISQYSSIVRNFVCTFEYDAGENVDLENSIIIRLEDNDKIYFDAFDIEDGGEVKPYDPFRGMRHKILILNDGQYKKYVNHQWQTVSTITPTQAQFESDGMDAVPGWSALSQLTGEIEIVVWTDEETADRSLKINGIPHDQLVLPTKDIDIRSVENIDSFTLNVTQAGQGAVKTVVSFDSGTTWYTRSSGSWIEIDLANIKTEGLTPAVLNAITSSEWAALRGTSNTVRFAYHLSMEEVTDVVEVNDLISQMDMKGTWKKAVHGTDYDYEYPNNDQLTVTIYQSGDYKINY
ncbi:hypothetical protein [Bacillus sp. Hm123]|uniref:hypothetical protein n=1 Tax=Bacillus sp. Hm123 TaxID=3450745 RepID=UPI003F431268